MFFFSIFSLVSLLSAAYFPLQIPHAVIPGPEDPSAEPATPDALETKRKIFSSKCAYGNGSKLLLFYCLRHDSSSPFLFLRRSLLI